MLPFPRRLTLTLLDAVLLAVSWTLAYTLRFGFAIPSDYVEIGDYRSQLTALMAFVVLTHLGLFWLFRLYRGEVRYASVRELRWIASATALHLLLWAGINVFIESRNTLLNLPLTPMRAAEEHVLRVPWGILLTYSMLAVLLSGGWRMLPRLYRDTTRGGDGRRLPRTLIVGAKDLCNSLVRTLNGETVPSLNVICIVAEDPRRVGLHIGGIPVVGALEKLAETIRNEKVELVLVALDGATPERIRRVIAACESEKVAFRIVPTVGEIIGGAVTVDRLKALEIEDLLGREPHDLGYDSARQYIRGERVLVTGGGGSIGSELCRQIARCEPAALCIVGKGENSLFDIQRQLAAMFPEVPLLIRVLDVRDANSLRQLFQEYRPTLIYHAAAHKHVPLMEAQPAEAVRNNIIGTATMAFLADEFRAKQFILVSTDKAVRPTSIMGATKRVAELIVFSLAKRSNTAFLAVRFGNVLGSRGSVITVFRDQIAAGGPVRVTHPDVTRFFMTVPEAAHLVLEAGAQKQTGCLYLLDMGEPVRISDLAKNMIVLSGLRPDVDVVIEYSGLRPGEKLHEELLTATEGASRTETGKLFVTSARDIPEWDDLVRALEDFDELAADGDRDAIIAKLRAMVPEYQPKHMDPAVDFTSLRERMSRFEQQLREDAGGNDGELAKKVFRLPAAEPPAPVAEEPAEPVQVDLFEEWGEAPSASLETPAAVAEEPPVREPAADDLDLDSSLDFILLPDETEQSPVVEPTQEVEEDLFAMLDEVEEPMETSAEEEPIRGSVLVLLDWPEGTAPEEAQASLEHWTMQLLASDVLVVSGVGDAPAFVPSRVQWVDSAVSNGAERLSRAIEEAEGCDYGVMVGPRLRLREGALEQLTGTMEDLHDAVGIYADFLRVFPDGTTDSITLQDHEGCIHERFDFGPLLVYHLGAVRHADGVDTSLLHAWEYDLHLRLLELGRFVRVPTTLAEVLEAPRSGTVPSKLYSPSPGSLGGFSYVFYPPELEREVTMTFEAALRRREAWLENEPEPVPYPEEPYPVLASIVIPVKDRERFIGHALRSVLSGTFADFEIIVVDNGSSDGTRSVVEAFAAEDGRVRLMHGTGSCIASALNEGIRAARGKYICQLDSDDEYAPTTLEKMTAALEADTLCGLAISYYRLMEEDGTLIDDVPPVTHRGFTRNQILRRDGGGAVRVFPKVVLELLGLYDEEHYGNFGEDYDMVLKISERFRVTRVPEVLYHYRRHADNTDVTRDPVMKYRNKNRARLEALRRRREINQRLNAGVPAASAQRQDS